MPTRNGKNILGFIDPISILGVLFLVVTLAIGTVVTTNKDFKLNIAEKAGGTCGYCSGATCVSCSGGKISVGECSNSDQCKGAGVPGGPVCGNGQCQTGETPQNCPNDCMTTGGPYCGDGNCNGRETPGSCDVDCGNETPSCQPRCGGRACGDDGCGDICGSCILPATCNSSGQCTVTCTPSCSGKQCGNNGCGGSCGSCNGGSTCISNSCVVNATPVPPNDPVVIVPPVTDPVTPVDPPVTTGPGTTGQTDEDLSRDCFFSGGQWNNTTKTCFNPDIADVADEAKQLIANNPIINPPADDYDIESTRVDRKDDTASNIVIPPSVTTPKYTSKADCQANVNPNSKAYDACGQYATSSENQNVILQNTQNLLASLSQIPTNYVSYWQNQTGNQEVNFTNFALATYKMITPDFIANPVLERFNLRDEADSYLDIAFNQQTTLDTADLITFDKTSRYVSNYQRINEQTYSSNSPDIVNYLNSFNAGIRDKETLASTIDLGVTMTAEAYALTVAAPLAITSGGVIPGALSLMGQAQVVSTVMQTGSTASYCTLNGWDESCQQQAARTGLSWGTMGISQVANTSAGLSTAYQQTAKILNTVTTAANFAVDSSDAIVAFSDPNTDSLTRAMSLIAVVGDIGGGIMDFNQGQLGFSAPHIDTPTNTAAFVNSLSPDWANTSGEFNVNFAVDAVTDAVANTPTHIAIAPDAPGIPRPEIPLVEIEPVKMVDAPTAPKPVADAGDVVNSPVVIKPADVPVVEKITDWINDNVIIIKEKRTVIDLDAPNIRGGEIIDSTPKITLSDQQADVIPSNLPGTMKLDNVRLSAGSGSGDFSINPSVPTIEKYTISNGGPPPKEIDLSDALPRDLSRPQQAIIDYSLGTITRQELDDIIVEFYGEKLKYQFVSYETLTKMSPTAQLGTTGINSKLKVGVVFLLDPAEVSRVYGVSIDEAVLIQLQTLGHEFGESFDGLIRENPLDPWPSEYRARTFDQMFIEKLGLVTNPMFKQQYDEVQAFLKEIESQSKINTSPPIYIKVREQFEKLFDNKKNADTVDIVLSKDDETNKLVKYIVGPEVKDVDQLAQRMQSDQNQIINEYGLPPYSSRFKTPEQYRQSLITIAEQNGISIKPTTEVPPDIRSKLLEIFPSGYIPPFYEKGVLYLPNSNSISDNDLKTMVHELTHGLDEKFKPGLSIEQREYRAYIVELGDAVAVRNSLGDNFTDYVFGQIGVKGSVKKYYTTEGITEYPWNNVQNNVQASPSLLAKVQKQVENAWVNIKEKIIPQKETQTFDVNLGYTKLEESPLFINLGDANKHLNIKGAVQTPEMVHQRIFELCKNLPIACANNQLSPAYHGSSSPSLYGILAGDPLPIKSLKDLQDAGLPIYTESRMHGNLDPGTGSDAGGTGIVSVSAIDPASALEYSRSIDFDAKLTEQYLINLRSELDAELQRIRRLINNANLEPADINILNKYFDSTLTYNQLEIEKSAREVNNLLKRYTNTDNKVALLEIVNEAKNGLLIRNNLIRTINFTQQQLDNYPLLQPWQKDLLDDSFPVVYGVQPLVGRESVFMSRSDVDMDMGFQGGFTSDEIKFVYVPKSEIPRLEKLWQNLHPNEPMTFKLVDIELLNSNANNQQNWFQKNIFSPLINKLENPNPPAKLPKKFNSGQGMTGLMISASIVTGLGYANQYFDWGITDKAVEIFNNIFGIETTSGTQSDKSITPNTSTSEIEGYGSNNLAKYLAESPEVITPEDITPPSGLTKTTEGRCQRVDRSNPCDGNRMYEMYLWYKSQPEGWWYTNGEFTPADFLALMLVSEAGNSDTEFLNAITTASSSQLWGSSAEHQPYCTTSDCEAGIFNFIGAYMQSASRRYNEIVLNENGNQESVVNIDKTTAENFARNGIDLRKIANDTIYNPVSKTYNNDTPVHWGNFGCGPECEYLGPNWIKDRNQAEVQTGTTDRCGLYDMYGTDGVLAVVFTNNQKYNWTSEDSECFK